MHNQGEAPARYMVIGTRAPADRVTYPEHDRALIADRSTGTRTYETPAADFINTAPLSRSRVRLIAKGRRGCLGASRIAEGPACGIRPLCLSTGKRSVTPKIMRTWMRDKGFVLVSVKLAQNTKWRAPQVFRVRARRASTAAMSAWVVGLICLAGFCL